MRTSKIEKKINQIIIEDSQVPDSVLDMAREKMKANSNGYQIRTYYKKIRSLKIALIILLCLWIPTIGIVTFQEVMFGNNTSTYYYEALDSKSIESVKWYNETYEQNYLWVEDLPILSSYELKDKKGKVILLEEHYQDDNHEVVLYIQRLEFNVIYKNYESRDISQQKNSKVSCAYLNTNTTLIRFYKDDMCYIIELDYIEPYIKEKLEKLFKNQSFFD